MPQSIPEDSVGIVTPQTIHFDQPLALACGRQLDNYDLIIETYGTLNADASNAVLVCHALSGNHHLAGYHSAEDKKPGWWDSAIGPGKPIDTDKLFVIGLNNLGGCHGSTGPQSTNPKTAKPFGPDFPIMTVADWVESQARLADHYGIQQWAAIVGGSLGGMQALQWAIDYPQRLRHCMIIAAAPKLSAQNIAFNEVARQAISRDPDFNNGHFYENGNVPKTGLMLARMLGHITYLSDDGMREKFGRELREGKISYDFNPQFEIESYLRYQGEQFSKAFDANTYLLMTKALDYFDPAADADHSLSAAVRNVLCKFMVISFTTDWRFSPERSREIVDALVTAEKRVSYAEIDSHNGHDAFLIPNPRYMDIFSAYMKQVIADIPQTDKENN
ncbi:homoserine O-succinyltransferase MetX [Amphritea japonica]|uniref:Homoserine O-succinyltransferase n=1 Tax=Amphritea japonica ATCC BAA-1530 TaxID=1278309 RepID=A0A7R6PJV7_9GAMM|nr:homoserine O-acetyltransferase [Amphritea japonica]BBB24838.1 homoserine O-acetyltransferase [Amphritea japonica ATCC BAA-1530]